MSHEKYTGILCDINFKIMAYYVILILKLYRSQQVAHNKVNSFN